MTREKAMWDAGERLIAGPRPMSTNEFIEAGADAERARVVAWLRELAAVERSTSGPAPGYAERIANAIERGEHWEGG
jgi:hypothetical protein